MGLENQIEDIGLGDDLKNEIGNIGSKVVLGVGSVCMGVFVGVFGSDDKSQSSNLFYFGGLCSALFLGSLAYVKYSDEIKNKKDAVVNNVIGFSGVVVGMLGGYYI